jgi:hypothetical protein
VREPSLGFLRPNHDAHFSYLRQADTHGPHSRISVDSRLHHMLTLRFDEPFFQRGDFPLVVQASSPSDTDGADEDGAWGGGGAVVQLQDPWVNGTVAAPFDQGECPSLSLRCAFGEEVG